VATSPKTSCMKNESLQAAVETARSLAREIAAPNAETVDREGFWPELALRSLQQAGLGGLVVPARHGGMGHGLLGLALVCDELGRACSSTSMCFGMHSVGAAVLAAKATPEQVDRYLGPINEGRHLTTLALSEPGTGVHFYFPECQCRAEPDGSLVLSGTKSFVTNGGHADSYVVSVQRPDLAREAGGRFSCVVVDRDTPGATFGPEWDGLGLRGNSSRELSLEGVRLPGERRLGVDGDQLWYVFHVVAPYFLTAMAGTYLGIAQAALDECRRWLADRLHDHSGKGPVNSPVVQHRLGTIWARVARSRAFLAESASRADRSDEDALPAILSVKAEIAECANDVVAEALRLTGGRSYRSSSTLHRLMRDAAAAHVMSPTTDQLRQWVGRTLFGLPILAD